jgi:hypothetical protein
MMIDFSEADVLEGQIFEAFKSIGNASAAFADFVEQTFKAQAVH